MRIYWRFILNCARDFSIFRFDMIVMMLDLVAYIASIYLFWLFVMPGQSSIDGWESSDLIVLAGFAGLWLSLNGFLAGTWELSGKLLDGGLDKYLCRPMRVIPSVIGECFQVDELIKGLVVFAVAVGYFHQKTSVSIEPLRLLLSSTIFIFGTVIVALMKCCISMLTLWLGNMGILRVLLYFEDMQIERVPTVLLKGGVGFLLNYVLPAGAIATWPTAVLLGKMEMNQAMTYLTVLGLLIVFWSWLTRRMFLATLRRYDATGG